MYIVALPTFPVFLLVLIVPDCAVGVAYSLVCWVCYENISFGNSLWNDKMTILFPLPTYMQCSWSGLAFSSRLFLLVEVELGLRGSCPIPCIISYVVSGGRWPLAASAP
jgi:hypothetical protein